MFKNIFLMILCFGLFGCGMTPEQRNTLRAIGQGASCLTLEGCAGQPRYDNPRNGVFRSAITIKGTSICPIDVNLGSYSHSTSSGLNKICYYN